MMTSFAEVALIASALIIIDRNTRIFQKINTHLSKLAKVSSVLTSKSAFCMKNEAALLLPARTPTNIEHFKYQFGIIDLPLNEL